MRELWKPVVGYEGLYEVSTFGRVKALAKKVPRRNGNGFSIRKERIMALATDKDGYKTVGLVKLGSHKTHKVHRLVACTFIGNKNERQQVNHKNGDKQDNSVSNLEWVSPRDNIIHKYRVLGYTQKDTRKGNRVVLLDSGKSFVSIKSAARALGVAPMTIRNWAKEPCMGIAIEP